MSYELKNGKLQKEEPSNEGKVLKYRLVAEVTVRVEKPQNGGMKIIDASVKDPKVATHPADGMSKDQLKDIMANDQALMELAGVLVVEHVHRKRNPMIAPSTGNAGKGRGPGGTDG